MMALMSCIMTGCDNESSATAEEAPSQTGKIMLSVAGGTRLAYDGASTTFEDGDELGCVVCTMDDDDKYVWAAATKWVYRSGLGVVRVSQLYTKGEDETYSWEDAKENDTDQLISYDANGYTGINSTETCYLFFYYPFDETNVPTESNFSTYEFFVDNDATDIRVNDLMWAKLSTGVNKSSTGSYGLTFTKKTATIEITSEEAISNVKLIPGENNIVIGKKVNLTTGTLSDFSSDDDSYSKSYITSSSDISSIEGKDISTNSDGTLYRIMLPAQESFDGQLQFTYDSDEDENTQTVDLSDFSSLSSGILYSVKINPTSGATTQASTITLSFIGTSSKEFASVASEDGVFSSLEGSYKYNTSYTCTVGDNTYTTYYQISSSSTITFTIESTMNISLYYGNISSNIAVLVTDSSGWEKTFTADEAIESSTDEDTEAYIKFSLPAGTYTISKASSNGATGVFLVVLEYPV